MAKKKTNPFTAVIVFLIVVLLTAGMVLGAMYLNKNKEEKIEESGENVNEHLNALYDEIMEADYEYITSSYEVIEEFNKTMLYLYSGETNLQTVPDVLKKQRQLFTKELQENNIYEVQLEVALEEIENFNENGVKIIEIKVDTPIETNGKPSYTAYRITQYLNTTGNREGMYLLTKEDKKWKIVTWGPVEDFIKGYEVDSE